MKREHLNLMNKENTKTFLLRQVNGDTDEIMNRYIIKNRLLIHLTGSPRC